MPREIFGYAGETAAQKSARARQEREMVRRQESQNLAIRIAGERRQAEEHKKALEAQAIARAAPGPLMTQRRIEDISTSARQRDLLEQRYNDPGQRAEGLLALAAQAEQEYRDSGGDTTPSGNIFVSSEKEK